MKNVAVARRSLDALFVALLTWGLEGCVSSAWERTEKVTSNGSDARLYVPKLWAPLLPGSVYPNKRVPVRAKGRPSVVVVCPAAAPCPKDRFLPPLAERGLVVLLFERPPNEPPREDLLRTRPEAAGAPTGWLLISPTEEFLGRLTASLPEAVPTAVAILWSRPLEPAALLSISSLSKQIFGNVPRRVLLGALLGSEADLSSEGVVEKLYAPDAAGRFPREAYRDAGEWLAGELGAR